MGTFAAGSGPGAVSTPSCDIIINNDNTFEQNEMFSLSATILNSNGQAAQFTAGGDSALVTIIDNDGMWLIHLACLVRLFSLQISIASKCYRQELVCPTVRERCCTLNLLVLSLSIN